MFSESNPVESLECYLLGDVNINMPSKGKGLFRKTTKNHINDQENFNFSQGC